jgi:hypothetical protein
MSTSPLVSIIIPCFNQAMYLRDALESLVAQTYKNLEVILINDGSTDGSEDIITSIYAHYKNFLNLKAFSIPNSGVAIARNVAISQSAGDYFVPLDADDAIHGDFVQKTLSVILDNPEISFVYTDYELFGDVTDLVEAEEYEYWRFLYDKNLCASTALIKKKAWSDAGGYNPNMIWGFEDWEFWIACGARNSSANANSQRLFARMALNHSRMYPAERVDWAIKVWAAALQDAIQMNDRLGQRYIKSLTAEQVEREADVIRRTQNPIGTIKLYEKWLEQTNSSQREMIIFNLAIESERARDIRKASTTFSEIRSSAEYKVAAELGLRRLGVTT